MAGLQESKVRKRAKRGRLNKILPNMVEMRLLRCPASAGLLAMTLHPTIFTA